MTDELPRATDATEPARRDPGASRSLEAEAMLRRISTRLFGVDERPVYIGRFRVLQTIGQGGMGAVYSAEDEQLGRVVALKVIRPDVAGAAGERQRLIAEARALARLAHPNVVHVHEVGEHGEEVFIAMEYVPGKTLDRWLTTTVPSIAGLLAIFVAVGRGLAAAHAAGVVHRDIKPTNVLVGDDGRPRILDFGLARGVHEGGETQPGGPPRDPLRTGTDTIAGTPAYMSPEQASGRAIDARSDQFSYCATIYEAIYGLVPFPVGVPHAGSPGFPATVDRLRVPAWLRAALARGLEIDPPRRFASMAALVDVLESEPRRRQRRAWFAGAAVTAAVVAGVAVPTLAVERCPVDPEGFAGTWGDAPRARVRATFMATGLPYAGRAADRVVAALDGYAARWVAARRDACEATRVRGEGSEALLDRSVLCLEQQRRAVATLVELVTAPDVRVVAAADELMSTLPRPGECRDPARLLGGPPRAPSPEVVAAEDRLHRVGYLHLARGGAAVLPTLEGVVAAGRDAGDHGLEAAALLLRGRIEATELRDPRRAADSLHAAAYAALTGGRDEVAAATWGELARVYAQDLEQADAARMWLRYAGSVPVHDADQARLTRATLLDSESYVALLDARYEAALGLRREALGLRERALPPGDPELTWSRVRVANATAERGDLAGALAGLQAIADEVRADLGDDHPKTVLVEREVALILVELERFSEARALLRHARGVLLEVLGPDNPHVASSDLSLAQIAAMQGDDPAVLRHAHAALAVFEARFPPAYSERQAALIELAEVYRRTRRHAEALPVHLTLLDIHDRFDVDVDVPGLLMLIGDELCNLGRCGDSLPYFARLRALFAREPPEDRGLLAYAAHGAGLAHLADGKPALALPFFEDAYRTLEANPDTAPQLTAEAARSLATCLRALRVEPTRARRLERVAADILSDLGEPLP